MTTTNRFGRTRLLGLLSCALLLGSGQAWAANDGCNGNANDVKFNPAAVSAAEGSTFSMALQPSSKGAVFTWSWVSGPVPTFNPSVGDTVSITLPQIPGNAPAVTTIRVTASGCNRATVSETKAINVTQLVNVEPVALASASPASVNEGGAVSLVGTASYDPDNDPITYAWTQVGGPAVTITNANTATAGFTAPAVSSTTSLTFRLTVTENTPAAKSSYKDVIVNVLNVNVPPSAALSCPAEVDEGALLTLDGSGSNDPDSGVLSYSFSQLTGLPLASIPAGPYGSSVSFAAPALGLDQTGLVKFGLTVTDGDGASASADCSVFINDVTKPVLSGGGNQTLEATSPTGAVATYSVTSYDNVDGAGGAICVPPSGSDFPLGATPVACAQTDSSGNIGELGFTITVEDTTAPVIDAHGDEGPFEATGPGGATVTYTSPATTDAYDGPGVANCTPPSGSTFALGHTTVTCSASDTNENQAIPTTFDVEVIDSTAPEIGKNPDMTVEATGPDGAAVTFDNPTATDVVDGETAVTCLPASGSAFGLGTTTVTCSTEDNAGNTNSSTFDVTVEDTTAPEISAHGNEVVEATGPSGATVNYVLPTASDLVDGDVAVTCSPASGSTFALGTATVNCSATDAAGNEATSSFTVAVRDTTPPSISAHGNEVAEATGPSGAAVSYVLPTATDIVDGSVAVTCMPASGSTFALGTTTVNCSASDAAGNPASSSFTVKVQDTTAPVIAAHGDVTAEATGPSGAAVSYTNPTASDIVDGNVTVLCTPASGSTFALGTSTVNCSATDAAGNAASSSFSVKVQDTTAPAIAAHADVTAIATSASGAVVNYTLPTAMDLVDGSVAVTCLPSSGSTFAIGSTTVNCSATDSHGNTGTSSFKVIVSYAFTGFFKPIDNLPIVNVTKAGQAIPVKFSLGGNMGLNIFAAGYPKSIQMACGGSAEDAIEETVTAGGSSLSYDATTGQYIYVWKSDKAWAGTCRQLQVKFADGQVRYANFSFTR